MAERTKLTQSSRPALATMPRIGVAEDEVDAMEGLDVVAAAYLDEEIAQGRGVQTSPTSCTAVPPRLGFKRTR